MNQKIPLKTRPMPPNYTPNTNTNTTNSNSNNNNNNSESLSVVLSAHRYTFNMRRKDWDEAETTVRVVSPFKALGHGGMRVCYEVEEMDDDGAVMPCVAKFFRRNITDVVEKDYFNEGMAQCMCEEFAESFNRADAPSVEKAKISFLQCYVVRLALKNVPEEMLAKNSGFFSYRTTDSRQILFVMEPKLSGHFTKYNSNFGAIYADDKKLLSLPEGERRKRIFEAAEAFSHFTLVESGGSMLVCDLQGVKDFFTDPQIHTEDGKGLGMGNMGQEGIDKWVEKHQCNKICVALGLHTLGGIAPSATRDSLRNNRYVALRAQLQMHVPVKSIELIPLSKPLSEMNEEERVAYAIQLSQLMS